MQRNILFQFEQYMSIMYYFWLFMSTMKRFSENSNKRNRHKYLISPTVSCRRREMSSFLRHLLVLPSTINSKTCCTLQPWGQSRPTTASYYPRTGTSRTAEAECCGSGTCVWCKCASDRSRQVRPDRCIFCPQRQNLEVTLNSQHTTALRVGTTGTVPVWNH